MDSGDLVEITGSGAVKLGPHVVCDGFYYGTKMRVQTHVHADHLADFETSKGYQDIISSAPSYELLLLLKNADLVYRDNFRSVEYLREVLVGDSRVTLVPSGHILGASQVQVTLNTGERLGYSGDFQWPLERVVEAETLVLDSTHGNPIYQRRYRQHEVDERLLELLRKKVNAGLLLVRGHTGALQRVLTLIAGQFQVPLLGNAFTLRECDIYCRYGFPARELVDYRSSEGKDLLRRGRGIVLLRMNEKPPELSTRPIKVMLSGYISDPKDPILQFADDDFRVALSDHADFDGILDYVTATGAKTVITDNARGGHAVELAHELRVRLGINAFASGSHTMREWGRT